MMAFWLEQGEYLLPSGVRAPAWGAKKVGEKLSFSPRDSGGVTFRNDGYFGFTPK